MNNAILLQIQEKKAKEMELNSKAPYDNISFENHEKSNSEIPVEPSNPVKADTVPKAAQEPSEIEIGIM